jgi:hypothetical protein
VTWVVVSETSPAAILVRCGANRPPGQAATRSRANATSPDRCSERVNRIATTGISTRLRSNAREYRPSRPRCFSGGCSTVRIPIPIENIIETR